ncbi:TOR complex subunit lst8 [Linnemannia hyalina]|uniref:TOR complex subunit lst8 n=1 Tax=Linnemannia hyalina TaxID=64524 RepID=A0A9P7XNY4_9FUNG|nr:TOR complex subunit lst8 [Linnemannia hyalina]
MRPRKARLDFNQQLLSVVNLSKTDAAVTTTTGATNAITILVKAGFNFNGADLQGIKVPGADLSEGQFDSTLFRGADLVGVNLTRSWLRQADLRNAKMEDVRFGELPNLETGRWVEACVYSPDGKIFGVAQRGGGLIMYDTSTWNMLCQVENVRDAFCVVFSHNSRDIVYGCNDHTLGVWDCINGEKVFHVKGHTEEVTSVACSPCGTQIASASNDYTVRIWNSQTGESVFVLKGHTHKARSVKYSPDGRHLVSGSWDGTIRFWDPETGEPGVVVTPPLGGVYSLAYSPDGHNFVCDIAFSPDGRQIASGRNGGKVRLWDVETCLSIVEGLVLKGHKQAVVKIALSPCGRWIASFSRDETIRLWDLHDTDQQYILADLDEGNYSGIGDMMFSPSGHQLVVVCATGHVVLFVADTQELVQCRKLVWKEAFQKVAYSPNCQQLALGTSRTIKLWDFVSEEPSAMLDGHNGMIVSMAYTPCGQWIASSSVDNTVRVWKRQPEDVEAEVAMESWLCVASILEFFNTVQDIAWNPIVPMEFVTGCQDGSVRVWRVLSYGEGEGEGEDEKGVVVKMQWGTNLGLLCASGLIMKDVGGLSAENKKLLVQRGAIDDYVTLGEGGRLDVEE